MCKTNRTLLLESALLGFFKDVFNIKMSREYSLPNGGRADLAGVWYDKNGNARDVVVVEIKQSAIDLKSKYGHNFVGTSNYLAVPTELVGEALLYLRDCCGDFRTGVIEITDKWKPRIVKYPMYEYNNVVQDEIGDKIMYGEYAGYYTPHIYKTVEAFL